MLFRKCVSECQYYRVLLVLVIVVIKQWLWSDLVLLFSPVTKIKCWKRFKLDFSQSFMFHGHTVTHSEVSFGSKWHIVWVISECQCQSLPSFRLQPQKTTVSSGWKALCGPTFWKIFFISREWAGSQTALCLQPNTDVFYKELSHERRRNILYITKRSSSYKWESFTFIHSCCIIFIQKENYTTLRPF